ncbi:MAG: Lrp/AsnC family transcriptional regulator [Phormidesmis sp.]
MKKCLRTPDFALDDVDIQLLRVLHKDARTSIANLARTANMSAPSVSERLRRLKESGIVENFTVEVDCALFGYRLAFYIRISPLPGQLSKVVAVIKGIEEIVECVGAASP